MTYSKPMGMLYATAGVGPSGISPPFRKHGFRAFDGLGQDKGQDKGGGSNITVSVRELQIVLRAKGFDAGTVDGVWGSKTRGALTQAAARAGKPVGVPSSSGGNVTLSYALMAGIKGLPDRAVTPSPSSRPSSTPSSSDPDIIPDPDDYTSTGGGAPSWLPWVLGAGALVLVGGVFVARGRKKKPAQKKRQKRASSRRRSR